MPIYTPYYPREIRVRGAGEVQPSRVPSLGDFPLQDDPDWYDAFGGDECANQRLRVKRQTLLDEKLKHWLEVPEVPNASLKKMLQIVPKEEEPELPRYPLPEEGVRYQNIYGGSSWAHFDVCQWHGCKKKTKTVMYRPEQCWKNKATIKHRFYCEEHVAEFEKHEDVKGKCQEINNRGIVCPDPAPEGRRACGYHSSEYCR